MSADVTVRRAILPLLCLLPTGCYTAPELKAHPSWPERIQRVFASDFSTTGWARRSEALRRPFTAVPGELLRVERFKTVPAAAAESVARAGERIPQTVATLAANELERPLNARTSVFARLAPDRIAHDVGEAAASVPHVLGLDRRPLGEIDDREHRTDPHDDRPEATLWQRIARRLRL